MSYEPALQHITDLQCAVVCVAVLEGVIQGSQPDLGGGLGVVDLLGEGSHHSISAAPGVRV